MKYLYIYLLILFVIIGAWLRFDRLGERSFWFDEIVEMKNVDSIKQSDSLADSSIGCSYNRVITRGYYFILNLLERFGYNKFTARLPAAIFGILAVPLAFFLGSAFFEKKTGILSSFLLSLSTFHIAYSQEARPYSMLMFFSILTYLCFYKALKQNSIIWWICFFLFTLLNIYTHYAAFYVLGSQIAFAVIWMLFYFQKNRKIYIKLVIILLMLFLLALVLLKPVILKAIHFIIKPELRGREVYELSLNFSFFYKMFGYFSSFSMTYGYGNWLYILYAFFFLLGIIGSIKIYRMNSIGILILMIAPFIMLFTIFKPFGFFNVRYFIFLLPVFLVVISRGIVVFSNILNFAFKKIKVNYFLSAIALLIGVIHIPTLIVYHYSEKDDWRGISAYLDKHITAGDQILINTSSDTPCLVRYLSDMTKQIVTISAKFDEDRKNNIWYIKYFDYKFTNLFNKMRVLDMKAFDNYITVFKLKREDLLKEEDIRDINFKIESENQLSNIGVWTVDKDASGKKARFAKNREEGWLVPGPHIVLPEGKYEVRFRIKVRSNNIRNEVAILNVYKGGDALKTPYINLKGSDFQKSMRYQDFCLEFNQTNGDRQEFRVYSLGRTDLWVDYVEVHII